MSEKIRPTDYIEKEQKSQKGERAYVKFPGKEIVPVTLSSREIPTPYGGTVLEVKDDIEKLKRLWKKHNKARYTYIHTHPYSPNNPKFEGRKIKYSPLPSAGDMNRFLGDDSVKSMAVAQINRNADKIEGYFYLRKTKNTKPTGYYAIDKDETLEEISRKGIVSGILKLLGIARKQKKIIKSLNRYERDTIEAQRADKPEQLFPLVRGLAEKYHLNYRFVPVEGYGIDEAKIKFVKKPSTLEQFFSATTAVIGFLGSLFFLSSNVTGNTIGSLSKSSDNWIGIVLLAIGLIGGFFWMKNRKK